MASPKLSVIIPVYNVAPYLSKCIDSVLAQTYTNMEIILINDGSTDESLDICVSYSKKYNSIKLISKINAGLAAARNEGLSVATGEYIAFLDSDDSISTEMYATLVELLEKNNMDVAECGTRNVDINGNVTFDYNRTGEILFFNRYKAIENLYTQRYVRFEVWDKVFRKSLLTDIWFKKGQIFEDVYFDRLVFQKMNGIVYIDKTFHNYLVGRPGSTVTKFSERKLGVLKEFEDFQNDMLAVGRKDLPKMFNALEINFCTRLRNDAIRFSADFKIQNELKNKFKKLRRQCIGNKYAKSLIIITHSINPQLPRFLLIFRNNFIKRNQ